MSKFKVGDKVRVRKDEAKCFFQPWRSRFEQGVIGTVMSLHPVGQFSTEIRVQFHPKRKPKRLSDWSLRLQSDDLEYAPPGQGKSP